MNSDNTTQNQQPAFDQLIQEAGDIMQSLVNIQRDHQFLQQSMPQALQRAQSQHELQTLQRTWNELQQTFATANGLLGLLRQHIPLDQPLGSQPWQDFQTGTQSLPTDIATAVATTVTHLRGLLITTEQQYQSFVNQVSTVEQQHQAPQAMQSQQQTANQDTPAPDGTYLIPSPLWQTLLHQTLLVGMLEGCDQELQRLGQQNRWTQLQNDETNLIQQSRQQQTDPGAAIRLRDRLQDLVRAKTALVTSLQPSVQISNPTVSAANQTTAPVAPGTSISAPTPWPFSRPAPPAIQPSQPHWQWH